MAADPHRSDPHSPDDRPPSKGGAAFSELSLAAPTNPATWRRARAHAYCHCGGLLDLTRSDTPEKQTGPNRTRIACVCESCKGVTWLTGKEMIDIARTLARRHAPAILANIVARADRMDALLHQLIDEEVLVRHVLPGSGEEVILPASPEEIAKVGKATLEHEALVLRAAGVQAEKVEVEVTHHGGAEGILDEIKQEIVREIRERAEKLERTVDAQVVETPAGEGA